MWILPKQLHTSAFVQDTKALGLDSEEFSRTCEKSLTWRGKDSLSRTWLQRWKRENWMRHLSSRTLNNSLTESFVDKWTSYLEDSRANPSVVRDSVKQLMTPDTCSHTSEMESGTANLELFSSKTLEESSQPRQGTENQFSNMSSENWKDWVTEQRQEYSQRQKLAHLTRENESLSWATPNTMDHMAERSPEAMERQFATHRKGRTRPSNLREQVNWPTARTSDAEGGPIQTELSDQGFRSKRYKSDQWFGAKLRDAVETYENWPTPTVMEAGKIGGRANFGQKGLNNHPAIRGEPDREKLQKDRKGKTRQWATPTSRDWKGSYKPESMTRKDGKSRMDALPQMAEYDPTSGRQDPTYPNTSGKNHVSLKLNPNWVEQLMGLPVGWTQIKTEQTD